MPSLNDVKILVTGSAGQLGQAIQKLAPNANYTFLFYTKKELDITDQPAVEEKLLEKGIKYIINCAAYTKVDQAEDEIELCNHVNVQGALILAEASLKNKQTMIQISSDYVYHPDHALANKETDSTQPKGVYAVSKLNGELAVIQRNPRSVILRTSWIYDQNGANFVNTIKRIATMNPQIKVVNDQFGSPTYADDLASAIISIIDVLENSKSDDQLYGIYNFSNLGYTTWYEFAKKIVLYSKIDCDVLPISSQEFPTKARRPKNSMLDKNKIRNVFGIKLKPWKKSLEECLKKDS